MSKTDDPNGHGRDKLAMKACANDRAELALVLTMAKPEPYQPSKVRVSVTHVNGLDPAAGEDLMKHMVEAFKRWPEQYEGRMKTLAEAKKLVDELRPLLTERYTLEASEQGVVVRDTVRKSVTTFRSFRITAVEIRDMIVDRRRIVGSRTVEPRKGEGPHGAGPDQTT